MKAYGYRVNDIMGKIIQRCKYIMVFSAIAEAFLIVRLEAANVLFASIVLAGIAIGFIKRDDHSKLKGIERFIPIILQVIILGSATINWVKRFYETAPDNFQIKDITEHLLIIPPLFVVGFCGFFFLEWVIAILLHGEKINTGIANDNQPVSKSCLTDSRRLGFCFLCALIAITFCSECSFLYPMNDWVDVNCFMTVGKSMMNGIVPYRDLLEQKGPVLYFLYGIASLIGSHSLLGVYIFQVLSGTVFLFYAGKTVELFTESRTSPILIALMGVITYSSPSFITGGSVEEFCLPLLAYALYLGLKCLRKNDEITPNQWILIGISIGLILWSKFTILGFYIGFVLFMGIRMVRTRQNKKILSMLTSMIAGMLIISMPVLIYFAMHHAMKDLLQVYFYDNIFLYPSLGQSSFITLLSHYCRGLAFLFNKNCIAAILMAFACIGIHQKDQRKEKLFITVLVITMFIFSFIGNTWGHYVLPFTVFISIGIGRIAERMTISIGRKPAIAMALVLSVCCAFLTPNQSMMFTDKKDKVQYKFAEIITQTNNPTLLNYGFIDRGFYFAADVLPSCKAFCTLNSLIPELNKLQSESIEKGLTDYVVSEKKINNNHYIMIANDDGYFLYKHN